MSLEVQGRVKSLQEQLAVAIAEQEVEAARFRGDEALLAEEAGRGTRTQDEALRAKEAELKGLFGGEGRRHASDGTFGPLPRRPPGSSPTWDPTQIPGP